MSGLNNHNKMRINMNSSSSHATDRLSEKSATAAPANHSHHHHHHRIHSHHHHHHQAHSHSDNLVDCCDVDSDNGKLNTWPPAGSPNSGRSSASHASSATIGSTHGGGGRTHAHNGHNGQGGNNLDNMALAAAAADAEGVWSPDIDQSFQEALAIYPPCGRRKIILSEEGKMYGRNELIARYIKLRTGKTRTRKQVSSHIQVLARKKSRELQAKLKDQSAKEKALNTLSGMSSAQIVSMSALQSKVATMSAAVGLAAGSMYGPMWSPAAAAVAAAGFSPQTAASVATLTNPLTAGDVDVKPPFNQLAYPLGSRATTSFGPSAAAALPLGAHSTPAWEGRTICTPKIRLCEFVAYCNTVPKDYTKRHEIVNIGSSVTHADPLLEAIDISQIYDKFPSGNNGLRELYQRGPQNAFFLVKFWADLSFNVIDEQSTVFAVDSWYESSDNMTITVSTKVCSFGKQVVEKVEHEYAKFENGRFVYRIQRSPMCEYMNNFIHKLKKLPERYMMNSVLENFTILQLVTSKETQDILLCIAFVFEVSDGDGYQHRLYKLTYGNGK